ncbi:MAG: sugar phosphate nucleotidyltransferase [Candidatus Thorarchaeota archaeon]
MPDSLESIMSEIRARINTEPPLIEVPPSEVSRLKSETVVVMPAGGRGTRIRSETHNEGINKVMISLGCGESMIEKAVREYSECGITRFVVLTGFLAERVESHLGDGSRWGVEIRYSRDPDGRMVGSAGAILNAINNGTLDDQMTAIVHNPDDVIVGLDRPYGEVFLEGHLRARRCGCIATFVVVPSTPYQYSGLVIERGIVRDITKYPLISVPAHTGITVLGPEVYDYFRRLVSLDREMSFENVVAPEVARDGRLFAINIPPECWIPVNDLKGYEKACDAIRSSGRR